MRRLLRPNPLSLAALLAALGLGAALTDAEPAAPGDLTQVDSILDRLEKRLLDQEADGLSYGERLPQPATGDPTEGLITKYRPGSTAKIEAAQPAEERVKPVAALVADLEAQIDLLAGNVQRTRQSILDEAAIDNFVSLEAALEGGDTAAIKAMSVKLDGYPVYDLSEAAGLWMPSKSVPLYAGPMQPGTHRIDLEVRLVVRQKQSVPLNGDIYRFVNKTFDLTVGAGVSNSRYVIAITPPDKLEGSADAALKEML